MSEIICRTADGEICASDDPRAAFVVVGIGGHVPPEYADAVEAYRAKHKGGNNTAKAKPADESAEKPAPKKRAAKKAAAKD